MHRVALLLAPAIAVALAPPTRVIVEEFAVARRSGAAYGRLGGQPGGAVEFAVVRGRREEDGATALLVSCSRLAWAHNLDEIAISLAALGAAMQHYPSKPALRGCGLALFARLAEQAADGDEAVKEALDAAGVPSAWREAELAGAPAAEPAAARP